MYKRHDFWYAVNVTEVVLPPKNTLETFGASVIKYHVISEFPDEVGRIRIRAGQVHSERPQIITPNHFAQSILSGFGEDAKDYADWLRNNDELGHILKYGLQFRKERVTTEETHGLLTKVTDKVKATVEMADDPMSVVMIGDDDLWDVSLLKFLTDFIERSAPVNVRDFSNMRYEASMELRREIEMDFRLAQRDKGLIQALGDKLRRMNLFDKFEDRFFALMKGNQ